MQGQGIIGHFAVKMNFYLSAVDERLRHKDDQPSIILYKTKNKLIVEYTLRDTNKPVGVSAYQLTESQPKRLKGSLPSVEEFEAELGEVNSSRDTRKTLGFSTLETGDVNKNG
jgi:hypothetical protein